MEPDGSALTDRPAARDASRSLADIGLDAFAPYLMNRIMGRYNAALRAEMAALGLTTPQMRALAVLSVVEAPLIGELAVFAVVDPSTLSRALDQLGAEGHIARLRDAGDSRAVRVRLAPSGRALFARLWPQMAAAHARMFAGIAPEDHAAFVRVLRRMLANIRQHEV